MVASRSFSTGPTVFEGESAPGIHFPTAIALVGGSKTSALRAASATEFVVADASSRLFIVNTQGVCKKCIGKPGIAPDEFGAQGVHAIAVSEDGKSIYVADTNNHRVQKIQVSDDKILAIAGSHTGRAGSGVGQLYQPSGLALIQDPDGKDGQLFVSDSLNHRVSIFSLTPIPGQPSPTGEDPIAHLPPLKTFGAKGRGRGCFQFPRGLAAWDKRSTEKDTQVFSGIPIELFVADTRNHRVQTFTPDGAFLRSVGGAAMDDKPSSSAAGKAQSSLFEFPSSVLVAPETGHLFVADQRTITVLALQTLSPLSVLSISQPIRMKFPKPASLPPFSMCAVPPTSRSAPLLLYVAEYTEHAIRELALFPEDLRSSAGDSLADQHRGQISMRDRLRLGGTAPHEYPSQYSLGWYRGLGPEARFA